MQKGSRGPGGDSTFSARTTKNKTIFLCVFTYSSLRNPLCTFFFLSHAMTYEKNL